MPAIVGFYRLWLARAAIASLVWHDDVITFLYQHRNLVTPAESVFRPTVGQHHRYATLSCLKDFKLDLSHFNHFWTWKD
jgi:hypothetical protein